MIESLSLSNFKNFRHGTLSLGPLSLLVGANATGKSNVRDAFRFLHGVGRGYSLAEIIGEKYGEGGALQWRGMRGGMREIALHGTSSFALEVTLALRDNDQPRSATYRIEVGVGTNGASPLVVAERLVVDGNSLFDTEPSNDPLHLRVAVRKPGQGRPPIFTLLRQQPVLTQCVEHAKVATTTRTLLRLTLDALADMRFLDLHPDAMRQASFPGQMVLGDRGENLSSVLHAICEQTHAKQILLAWLKELTPMDAVDVAFPTDQIGRILVSLMEENGTQVSAYSASDGTLRFLGMLAALLGPEPAGFYFFEELDNGIHPTRLHLLLQLVEQQTKRGPIQVVATTHSPQILRLIAESTLEHTSLTYRLPGEPYAQITRILDLPEARRVISEQDLARLHESGWLEDSVAFMREEAL